MDEPKDLGDIDPKLDEFLNKLPDARAKFRSLRTKGLSTAALMQMYEKQTGKQLPPDFNEMLKAMLEDPIEGLEEDKADQ